MSNELDELQRLMKRADETADECQMWYDSPDGHVAACALRNAAPSLIVAARERDELKAELLEHEVESWCFNKEHAKLEAENTALRKALEPFAQMARPETDPQELACQRGIASDMTCIWSGDFDLARAALAATGPKEPKP